MNLALQLTRSNIRFKIIFGNTRGSSPPVGLSEALRLLNEEGVLAMVSSTSGVTIQVNRLNYDPESAAPYQFPVNCYQCSSGEINNPDAVHSDPVTQAALRDEENWLRRVFYLAGYEAAVLDQVIANLGDRNGDGNLKLSILADPGHMSLANAIPELLPNFYTEPATIETVVLSDLNDLDAKLALVTDNYNESTGTSDGEPDYIVLAMLPGTVTAAVQAYRTTGYTLPLVSNNSFRRNYIIDQIGADANGIEGSSVAVANQSQSGQMFVNTFAELYGEQPEQTCSGAYDAAVSLMLASLKAARHVGADNVTPADIQDELDNINAPGAHTIRPSVPGFMGAAWLIKLGFSINYDGAYDPLEWDSAGNLFPALVHWKVENEQFIELESYMCDPDHPLCPVIP
jgi:hypothetical protein